MIDLMKVREAAANLVNNCGYSHMSDDELRHEESLGNQFAPLILEARAQLASPGVKKEGTDV